MADEIAGSRRSHRKGWMAGTAAPVEMLKMRGVSALAVERHVNRAGVEYSDTETQYQCLDEAFLKDFCKSDGRQGLCSRR